MYAILSKLERIEQLLSETKYRGQGQENEKERIAQEIYVKLPTDLQELIDEMRLETRSAASDRIKRRFQRRLLSYSRPGTLYTSQDPDYAPRWRVIKHDTTTQNNMPNFNLNQNNHLQFLNIPFEAEIINLDDQHRVWAEDWPIRPSNKVTVRLVSVLIDADEKKWYSFEMQREDGSWKKRYLDDVKSDTLLIETMMKSPQNVKIDVAQHF